MNNIKSNAKYTVEHTNGNVLVISGAILKTILRETPATVKAYREV